jgi:ribonuclease P protein component, eubacterial
MILVYVKSKQNLKVGFSVSKKVGNSVVRNHVKRLMKEAVRAMLPEVADRYNYIFVARPSVAELDFHAVSANIRSLFQKAGKLKEAER